MIPCCNSSEAIECLLPRRSSSYIFCLQFFKILLLLYKLMYRNVYNLCLKMCKDRDSCLTSMQIHFTCVDFLWRLFNSSHMGRVLNFANYIRNSYFSLKSSIYSYETRHSTREDIYVEKNILLSLEIKNSTNTFLFNRKPKVHLQKGCVNENQNLCTLIARISH